MTSLEVATMRRRLVPVALVVGAALASAQGARADACGPTNCVLMWNQTLIDIIGQTSGLLIAGPPEVANQMAILGTSMYDAVNAATGMQYQPVNYRGGAVSNASAEAAALAAGYGALMGVFAPYGAGGNPSGTANTFGGLLNSAAGNIALSTSVTSQINTAYAAALASLDTADPAVQAGLALGSAQAAATINLRNADNSYAAIVGGLTTYAPPGSGVVPGVYIPPGNRPAMYPNWGGALDPGQGVTPWTMNSATQFAPAPPPPVASAGYAASLLETQCLGAASGSMPAACSDPAVIASWNLPATAGTLPAGGAPGNSDLALYWNDPGGTLQPPGHWLQITDTAARNNNLDLLQSARISAEVGVAETDASIAAWHSKYAFNLWRPIDAINDCGAWNADFTTCDSAGAWTSVIATPPHPDYVAGHPAFSYAAATVLENFFAGGDTGFCSSSNAYLNAGVAIPAMTLCYSDFLAAASDAAISRVYGGIHTSLAVDAASLIGQEIGANVVANDFRQIPEPASLSVLGAGLAGGLALRRRRPG
jgi:hypothetical protein